MALRNLGVQQMISYTASLLDPSKPARRLLEQTKATSGLLEGLAEAHSALAGAPAPAQADVEASLRKIAAEQAVHDDVHDGLARGAFHLLTGLAEIARARSADARTRELLDLRDALFPQGIDVIKDTYADEASEALRVAAGLTAEQRAGLAAIAVDGGRSLLDEVRGRLDAAGALGALEDEKAALASTARTQHVDVAIARRRWLRAVRALATVIASLPPDEALAAHVVGPLAALEGEGDRAGRAGK